MWPEAARIASTPSWVPGISIIASGPAKDVRAIAYDPQAGLQSLEQVPDAAHRPAKAEHQPGRKYRAG